MIEDLKAKATRRFQRELYTRPFKTLKEVSNYCRELEIGFERLDEKKTELDKLKKSSTSQATTTTKASRFARTRKVPEKSSASEVVLPKLESSQY